MSSAVSIRRGRGAGAGIIGRTMHVTARFQPVPPPLDAHVTGDAWQTASPVALDRIWSGEPAAAVLGTTARVVWTVDHLWFGFDCRFTELDVDAGGDASVERVGLWERDVCEAFVRSPREPRPDSYKEFEVAPTGQWCDLAIDRPHTDVNWRWQSGIATAAHVDAAAGVWRAVMRIPFAAFGVTPQAGDHWHVNLFRISRLHGVRQYLAYAPTGTATPDFHVPERFVPLVFAAGPT